MSDETQRDPDAADERWCCGGNAEDCALCDTGRLPYPWICPGTHVDSPENRGRVLKAAAETRDRETIKATMRRLRRHDLARGIQGVGVPADVCEEPHETLEAEDACEAARLAELSAVQAWAEEPDLAAALGSFGDGYRQAQRDAQAALALDRLTPREGHEGAETGEHVYLSTGCLHGNHAYCQAKTGAVGAKTPATCKFCAAPCVCACHRGKPVAASVDSTDSADLDADAYRKLVAARLLAVATERVTREWICCDPVNDQHDLCVDGRNTITMLRTLLTDDETAFPPRSDLLDEVMRLVLGHADPAHRANVLATAEVRELYGKAVTRGLQAVVDWDGLDDLKPVKVNVIHTITAEVISARDRELARNRQRLLLANERHLDAVGALGAADAAHRGEVAAAVEAAVANARVAERLKVLGEVRTKLRGECASPFEQLAYHNVFLWLDAARVAAETTQRGLDTRSDG